MPESLQQLYALMLAAGAKRLYAKRLSANDNSKNQPYLGGDFAAITILPSKEIRSFPGGKRANFKAALDFAWLGDDGRVHDAPSAQLILYPRYPEVRLSGFLRGAREAPSELMNIRLEGRILFFGVRNDGKILAYVVKPDHPIAKELAGIAASLLMIGVFWQLPFNVAPGEQRKNIIAALRRIHLIGRIGAKRLTRSGVVPYWAFNAGGTTLEAELGILPNAYSAPDYDGWEVKSYSVSDFMKIEAGRLTLMTPEPTGGYYKTDGAEAFVRRFGHTDKQGRANRLNFSGIHKAWTRSGTTGLTLHLVGFSRSEKKIADPAGAIALVSDKGEVAAEWKFTDLLAHWRKKHALAAYVPYMKFEASRQFMYGPRVRLGEGTEFLHFMAALSDGDVFYDPGLNIKFVGSGVTVKKRSQFRIEGRNLPNLYLRMETVSLI